MGRRKRQKKTCYMCSEPATSREHVPPLCFFPEKDEFRKNLITIPSCEKHNSIKSGNDQYLFAVITSNIENNQIAREQSKKTLKAITQRPWLLSTFFKELRPIKVGNVTTGIFHVDKERFEESIDQISRGIYYHHFKKSVELQSTMISQSLFADSKTQGAIERNNFLFQWREYSAKMFSQYPKYGQNPAIYYYQIAKDEASNNVAIRHVFYEGVVIDVALHS